MKKIICLVLIVCMLVASSLSLFSCTQQNAGSGSNGTGEQSGLDGGNNSDNKNPDGELPDENNSQDKPNTGDSGNTEGGNDKDDPYNPGGESGNNPGGESGNNPGGETGNDNPSKPGDDNKTCEEGRHVDSDSDYYCDLCYEYVVFVIDFYVLNDLHGKFCDTDTQPGVDEIGTYIQNANDDNVIILSAGDMWQGSAESTLTKGRIMVEWMNALGFVAMTLGNHEFDWGEGPIRENLEYADFPFLAINIYDKTTGKLADYCTPSVMVDLGGVQVGIIGAIGDSYSSISSDKVTNVEFKLGTQLDNLIKAESEKLRGEGADFIVLSYHADTSEYNTALSNGYIDLVFEGHTHQSYNTKDSYGVYHLQSGGENNGICHVEITVNTATGSSKVNTARIVYSSSYGSLADHQPTEDVENLFADIIDYAYSDLGTVSKSYSDAEVEQLVADLYLEAGLARWGSQYDIVLAGGFIRTRSPYDLTAGVKQYADIVSLFPFDNQLVLCTVSGSNLKSRFINSTNSDYYVSLSSYGSGLSISNSAKYYVVVDTYTALYSYNGLTIVDYYDETTFARDLLAKAIKDGRLEIVHSGYSFTSIADVLAAGNKLATGQTTTEYYYIKGVITSISNTNYGNLYIKDESGSSILIYGLYDQNGNKFQNMSQKPQVGDEIIVYSNVYKYSATTIELKNATLIDINP